MSIGDILQSGLSSLNTSKASMQTSSHNISNANTEGYTRQRTHQATRDPKYLGNHALGRGVNIDRVSRVNDHYLHRQLQKTSSDLAFHSEKDGLLTQIEDVFNELGDDGINRLMTQFFNEFRKLANDPSRQSVRETVRESSQALVNDFHRIRKQVDDIRKQIDARIEGYVSDLNAKARNVVDLNQKILKAEMMGAEANDLRDQRDLALTQIGEYLKVSQHLSEDGTINVEMANVGPLVTGPIVNELEVQKAEKDEQTGRPEGALVVSFKGSHRPGVNERLSGGKIGSLIEVRDKTLSMVLERLDDLAFGLGNAVNQVHKKGITPTGFKGVGFFKDLGQKERASEFIGLSDDVKKSVNNIATAYEPNAAGDNRIAIAIAGLQNVSVLNEGRSTFDDWYNSIVGDVGVQARRNKEALGQQSGIMSQLQNLRDRVSGVSIDEETAEILKYQQIYDASAKVIQVADEMLKTVLSLKD